MVKKSPQGKVVEAVGVAARSTVSGLGKLIEQAMSHAVAQSYAEGVTEPDKVRARMLEARAEVKRQHQEDITRALAESERRVAQGTDAPAPKR